MWLCVRWAAPPPALAWMPRTPALPALCHCPWRLPLTQVLQATHRLVEDVLLLVILTKDVVVREHTIRSQDEVGLRQLACDAAGSCLQLMGEQGSGPDSHPHGVCHAECACWGVTRRGVGVNTSTRLVCLCFHFAALLAVAGQAWCLATRDFRLHHPAHTHRRCSAVQRDLPVSQSSRTAPLWHSSPARFAEHSVRLSRGHGGGR